MSKVLGKEKIFKIVEMDGNCMVENYLMKLKFQNLCVQMAKVLRYYIIMVLKHFNKH
jgi:hypothetical protein